MKTQIVNNKPVNLVRDNTRKLGFYSAILTIILTIATFAIAVNTPPLSGPFSIGPSFKYPYLDIASRFPRDYYWMFTALALTVVFVILMACIHQNTPRERKIFSQISFAFALISAGIIFIDYYLQLSVIQPSLINGETDGMSILTQYNPHGVFIALEDLGYLLMSVSLLFLAPAFSGKNGLEKALRWVFSLNFILTISSLILISMIYGIQREYRFEVVAISINWLSLIIVGTLLSVYFKRDMRN